MADQPPRRRSFKDVAQQFKPAPSMMAGSEMKRLVVMCIFLVLVVAAMIIGFVQSAPPLGDVQAGQQPIVGPGPGPAPGPEPEPEPVQDPEPAPDDVSPPPQDLQAYLRGAAQAFRDGEHDVDVNQREILGLLETFWRHVDPDFMSAHAVDDWSGDTLFLEPDEVRGEILRFHGRILQARTYPIFRPFEGGPRSANLAYVIDERTNRTFEVLFLVTEDTPAFHTVMVDTPDGPLPLVSDHGEFEGLFLRLHSFERYNPNGPGRVEPSPLFIARGYRFVRPAQAPDPDEFMGWLLGGTLLFVAGVVILGVRMRRKYEARPLHQELAAIRKARKAQEPAPPPPAPGPGAA